MISRNAEALFWIGRYMERAENHARLIDVHYHLQAEEPLVALQQGGDEEAKDPLCKWGRIVDALGSRGAYEQQYGAYTEQDVVYYVTLDRENPNSLVSCVNYARGNVRTLREKLPAEVWDTANGFYLWLREKQPADMMRESPHQFFSRVKEWTALFQGTVQSVMPRENEWYFIECGRYMERTENTLRILRSAGLIAPQGAGVSDGYDPVYPYLQAVLRSVSAYQPFRRYYADGFSLESIVEFLVLNTAFPRSVHFSLHQLDDHLQGIELMEKSMRVAHDRVLRQIAKIKADLACLEREDLSPQGESPVVAHLLQAVQQLGASFAQTFFRIGEASA
ncbi:putative alpha-E superfamily protein [Paenibacillus phyllosphaerae]|uniref:Putative alpha-E superfamily protein n=1 Tax=Paenibacillus phyllosphaerae TaxID=274593 RepID=A0A7W5ATB3_9BACL|nr:alpha-E domain-containing protein [Paenibacillus phyllosphaerae]MBB3108348.1 putative alpha-E superfamily protein [Paenibacillus phyllosphaerae]